MNVSSVKNLNGEVLSAVQDASLTNVIQTNSGNWQDITAYQNSSATYLTGVSIPESAVWQDVSTTVQSNSAQWSEGGGAISSYTTTWSHDVPPYGDHVINTLNEKYISAFISNSADKSKFANNANSANSANYAETVNETYLENKGFARNLSSEYGTVSIIHNNIIESTNSAIVRTGNEGFVSSFEGQSIGPEGNGTATYSWEKALPNTTINLDMSWSNNEILTYSANTDLTGEIVLPTGVNTQTINIPNATEFKVWSNRWIGLNNAVVSAADQFETVVHELAFASSLPTYEYDGTNKISAINGSALAGGNAEVENYVQTNSAQIDETVLFTSSWNDKLWNVNLSEPVSSFKKIRMYVNRGDGTNEPKTYEYETSLLQTYLTLEVDTVLTNEIYKYFTLCRLSGSTYTELSARIMHYPNTLDSWVNTNSWCHPIKIVGIGRISGSNA